MKTIVDRFPNELDQLRSMPNGSKKGKKNKSDLDLLINSIAAGVDFFTNDTTTILDPSGPLGDQLNPMLDLNLVINSIPYPGVIQTQSDPDIQMSA